MIIDARELPAGQDVDSDVAIVGAGAAGIAMARELSAAKLNVCLLESGGFDFEKPTQDLYQGGNIGLPYYAMDSSRLRYFGGSTNHWGGWSRPFDELDFEVRDWVPHSGWPITKADLDPYYERAQPVCGLGPYAYETADWKKHTDVFEFPGDRIRTPVFQISRTLRFGQAYRDELTAAENIKVYLNSNLIEIVADAGGQNISRLQLSTLEGRQFAVRAKAYVLAAGGIENPRLLLASNRVQRAGLGNSYDMVGRFFMEHIGATLGIFVPTDPYGLFAQSLYHTVERTWFFTGAAILNPEVVRKEKLTSFCAVLEPVPFNENAVGLAGPSIERFIESYVNRERPDDFMEHLKHVLADVDIAATTFFTRQSKGVKPVSYMPFFSHSEQVPNPDSRVVLSRERDQLGMNKADLDWRLTPEDKAYTRRSLEILAQELGRHNVGRMQLHMDGSGEWSPPAPGEPWVGPLGGYHHMGTTRMTDDPKKGVVDKNCKVHGLSNLFVAGSSVFTTAGYANPTLTLIALAIRLSDHLKDTLRT